MSYAERILAQAQVRASIDFNKEMKSLGFKIDRNKSGFRGMYSITFFVPGPKLAKTMKGFIEYHADGEKDPTEYMVDVEIAVNGRYAVGKSPWERSPEKALKYVKTLIAKASS